MELSPHPGLNRLYQAIGWGLKGSLTSATKNPDLRLSKLVAMADAVRADRLAFLETVLEEYVRSKHLPKPPATTTLAETNGPMALPPGCRAESYLGA
jgi:hypothetical protein